MVESTNKPAVTKTPEQTKGADEAEKEKKDAPAEAKPEAKPDVKPDVKPDGSKKPSDPTNCKWGDC